MVAHAGPVEHALVVMVGLGAVVLYGWAWFRSAKSTSRTLVSWCGGVAVLLLSVMPAMEAWAQRSFTGHMVQHLLMIAVAAPLLVLAAPVRTMQTSWRWHPSPGERMIAGWWRTYGALAAAAGFIASLYVTHLTSIYDTALSNRFVHDAEHIAYLASAIGLWAALRAPGRHGAPSRVGAVFAVIGASALLGVVLLSASSPLIPTYSDRLGRAAALDDQQSAAALMWVGGMATTLPLLLITVWRWAAAEQRIADRSEALSAGPTSEHRRGDVSGSQGRGIR